MRVRAATARMHAHTHVILAIASQRKGSQETRARVVVFPGKCFAGESKQKPARNTRAVFIRASASGLRGDPPKKPRAEVIRAFAAQRHDHRQLHKQTHQHRQAHGKDNRHAHPHEHKHKRSHEQRRGIVAEHLKFRRRDSNPGRSGEGRVS